MLWCIAAYVAAGSHSKSQELLHFQRAKIGNDIQADPATSERSAFAMMMQRDN